MRFPTALVLLGVVGCRSVSTESRGAGAVPEQLPSVAPSPSASPPAPAAGPALSVVYQGACPARPIGYVGTTPVLTHDDTTDPWTHHVEVLTDALPRELWTHSHMGNGVFAVGGIDEKHVWAELDAVLRGDESSTDVVFGKNGANQSVGSSQRHGEWTILEQPNGTLWVGPNYEGAFVALSLDDAAKAPKLPGKDMLGAKRMQNGELVAAGATKKGELVLRRWSPTRKVDDLVVAGSSADKSSASVLLGAKLAALGLWFGKAPVYLYDGESLRPSKLPPVTSWTLTPSDDLVATDGAEVWTEHADGRVEHQKVPAPDLHLATTRTGWLVSKDHAALYTRRGDAWAQLALPPGPWTSPKAGPSKVDEPFDAGDETLVLEHHLEPAGDGKPVDTQTLYSTRARPQAFRCGAPFAPFGFMPPRADASCKDPIVWFAREGSTKLPASYPQVAKALKGQPGLPASLDVVSFGDKSRPLTGIRAPSFEVATAVATALGAAKLQPEVLCGAPDEKRTLHFDVAAGTFAK